MSNLTINIIAGLLFAAPLTIPLVWNILRSQIFTRIVDAYEWYLCKLGFTDDSQAAAVLLIVFSIIGLIFGFAFLSVVSPDWKL